MASKIHSRSLRVALATLTLLVVVASLGSGCGRTPLRPGARSDGDGGEAAQGPGGQGPGGHGGQGPGGHGGQGPGGQGPGGQGPGGQGGGGAPPGCFDAFDCNDFDFCTTDRCTDGVCMFDGKDADEDGFIDVACGGFDCNDLNPNTHPGFGEVCTDAADNDCNGVSDCNDPACDGAPICGCTPSPGGESCQNGFDDDCDETVDCNDPDCVGTPVCGCAASETGTCQNGIDDDCDGSFDCDDSECGSTPACLCQTTPESCTNGEDDDCDLLIDCGDPQCVGSFACPSCQPPGSPENCSDGIDNDCDAIIDCADTSCAASPACQSCVPEVCTDGLDNDCDNQIDCADDACSFHPSCAPTQELCNNDLDDDNDSFIDCDDTDCATNPFCVLQQSNCNTAKLIPGSGTFTGNTMGNVGEHIGACGGGAGEAVFFFVLSQPSFVHLDTVGTSFDSVLHVRFGECESGAEIACDDDSGGFQWSAALDFPILYPGTYFVFVDGFTIDPTLGANAGPFVLNVQIQPNPPEICGDGIDNDGDVWVDCADPDCTNVGPCVSCNAGNPPGPEFGILACNDGLDNDCDGTFDCADDDCSASPYALTECCDGADDNDNGIADDFSCRCQTNADCGPGQICYTHTVHTCGLPCDAFFGMVCPSVAQGSFCSTASQQCEF